MGVKFVIDNPTSTPQSTHEAWMAKKIEDGWVWGPVKNADTKEHPCLVEYGNLPAEQRKKDVLFQAIVNALKDAA